MDLQFANPWVLYLLWLAPAMAVGWYAVNRRRERTLSTFISPLMQAKLRPPSSSTRFVWQIGLIAAGLLLMMVAAARPQWGMREETVYQRSRDLVIALDVSRSMLANDVHPNRLERAKADIMDLIKELPGDRVALVAFRRTAILLCPLTTDYAYLREALDAVTIDSAPRGETNIGDGIVKAMEAFESDESAHKAIILISDGGDLSGTVIKAAEKAGERHIPIFTVGIGNRQGSTIPEEGKPSEKVKYKGENVVTKLDNDVLYSIASKTGGAYLPVETASMTTLTLGTLYRDYLRQISGRDMDETLQRRHVERYQYFLFPAVLLLLAGISLSRGRIALGNQRSETRDQKPDAGRQNSRVRQTGINGAVALLFLSLTVAPGHATPTNNPPVDISTNKSAATPDPIPPGREGARMAQRLYLMGKYEEAARTYLETARSAGEKSSRDFRFNAAVAQFKAGNYREAADTLKDLAQTDKDGLEDVFMGLGSSLFRAAGQTPQTAEAEKAVAREHSLREAGESFKEAARIRSDNDTAKRDLAVVLDSLPEAEQQALTAKLMSQYAQADAGSIANEMLANQRKLIERAPAAFSNTAPTQIKDLESLAEEQKSNADLWIPLKSKLLNAMAQQAASSNAQQQIAYLNQMIETTRDQMLGSSAALRDLDPDGYRSAQSSEKAIYQFWRVIAPYPLLLKEDLLKQTNVIAAVPSLKADNTARHQALKANQEEALALTKLFTERFAQTVPAGGTEQGSASKQTNTNATAQVPADKQGISAENRQKILALADQAASVQAKGVQAIARGDEEDALVQGQESYRLLKEIEDLLPKNKNSSSSQQKEQQQEKQDESKKQDQSSEQQQPKPQPSQPEEKQNEKKPEPKENEQKKATPEDVKNLIERAMQREKEHDEEKRRMNNRFVPPSAIERDW